MKSLCSIAATLALTLLTSPAQSRTWYVKADHTGDASTIQGAIDSAQACKDVLVTPRTYTWTNQFTLGGSLIDMKSDIWLHSEAGPGVTILDAEEQAGSQGEKYTVS